MGETISIRIIEVRELRTLWDEQSVKCWWSVLANVAALAKQNDLCAGRKPVKQQYSKRRLTKALTSEIESKEVFMKGIDYSYYP